ncbi:MAG: nickel transporter [Caulobacterales bacterium 32-69-10]|nr:MAG: nickel transporter [Caulobacterales bacterium 32-69-10]
MSIAARLLACALLLLPAAAAAHAPYLLPNVFDLTTRDHVTVTASFTEVFFESEVVMKSDAYAVVDPRGRRTLLTPTYLSDVAVFEAPIPTPGTYRITTGARVGRVAKAYFAGGKWAFLEEPGDPVPAGATLVDMQSLTTADVYVSRGAPDEAALAPTGKGLEFRAITHPSSIFIGQDAVFEALFEGKPVPNLAVEISRGDGRFGDGKPPAQTTTGADGRFTVRPARPGLFHIMSRYRVPPTPEVAAARSFTYALTFEATE